MLLSLPSWILCVSLSLKQVQALPFPLHREENRGLMKGSESSEFIRWKWWYSEFTDSEELHDTFPTSPLLFWILPSWPPSIPTLSLFVSLPTCRRYFFLQKVIDNSVWGSQVLGRGRSPFRKHSRMKYMDVYEKKQQDTAGGPWDRCVCRVSRRNSI